MFIDERFFMISQPNLSNRAFVSSFFSWMLFVMHFYKVSITFKKLFLFWKKGNHLKWMRIYLFIYLIFYLFNLLFVYSFIFYLLFIMLISWSLKKSCVQHLNTFLAFCQKWISAGWLNWLTNQALNTRNV